MGRRWFPRAFELDPPDGATLTAQLTLVYDRPQVAARARLDLILAFEDDRGKSREEWHSAEPADGCEAHTVPEAHYDGLDKKPLEFGPPRCRERTDSVQAPLPVCCSLTSYFDNAELDAIATRCLEGEGAACAEVAGYLEGTDAEDVVARCADGDDEACRELRSARQ